MPFKTEIVFLGAGQTNIHFHTRWVIMSLCAHFPPTFQFLYKSFPVQNCAIWLAKALASLLKSLKPSVLSIFVWGSKALFSKIPLLLIPLQTQFLQFNAESNFSQFYTSGVLVDKHDDYHPLQLLQMFLIIILCKPILGSSLVVMRLVARGMCFSISHETGGPTLHLTTCTVCQRETSTVSLRVPSICSVREIGLSFLSVASS